MTSNSCMPKDSLVTMDIQEHVMEMMTDPNHMETKRLASNMEIYLARFLNHP